MTPIRRPTALITAEDLFMMEDDDFRYDLIDGKLVRMSPAGREHGRLAQWLGSLVLMFVRPRGLGEVYGAETGFILRRKPDVVLGPDVSFVRCERLTPDLPVEGYLPLTPDLAVEITSPSERAGEIRRTVQKYLDAGVPLLVLVYPRRREIIVYRYGEPTTLRIGGVLDGGDLLPGFAVTVEEIFAA